MYIMILIASLSTGAYSSEGANGGPIAITQEFNTELKCVTELNSIINKIRYDDKHHRFLVRECTPK